MKKDRLAEVELELGDSAVWEKPEIAQALGKERSNLEAVVHTIDKMYSGIEEVEELTGIPVVLNTSFNINGEPIVLSPDDALTTFFNSGLLYLVLGDVLVEKS